MTKPDRLLLDIALKEGTEKHAVEQLSTSPKVGECYTVAQVAELLQCSERHLLDLRKEHGLKFFKIDGMLRIPRIDFESWFQRHVKTLGDSDGSD